MVKICNASHMEMPSWNTANYICGYMAVTALALCDKQDKTAVTVVITYLWKLDSPTSLKFPSLYMYMH